MIFKFGMEDLNGLGYYVIWKGKLKYEQLLRVGLKIVGFENHKPEILVSCLDKSGK